MAALVEAQPELIPLNQLRPAHLEPILGEECRVWKSLIHWDFHPSADLVRRFVDVRALSGYGLFVGGHPAGYAYYVCEDHKGLIGDLYIAEDFRAPQHESYLLAAIVQSIMRTPRIHRIESQLMLLPPSQPPPVAQYLTSHPRQFMLLDLAGSDRLPERALSGRIEFAPWTERKQDETAALIASIYRNHIDSRINDQYRSASGAKRFLFNIVQYPGCGAFFEPAAWMALERSTGRICGVSLTSMVSRGVGHVTQICVSNTVRGKGVGYELLRRSLLAFATAGCSEVSLTVTSANREAVRLYERVGFRTLRRFPAMVWEGF